MQNKIINQDDLVIYKDKENIISGGYKINSLFLKENIPLIYSKQMEGGGIFDLDLGIPIGLLSITPPFKSKLFKLNDYNNTNIISDNVLNKLLNGVNSKKKYKNKICITTRKKTNVKRIRTLKKI